MEQFLVIKCKQRFLVPFRQFVSPLALRHNDVGETGVGCHTGWLSHCQYLIRWMAVPCGDLHVTCA